MVRTRDVIRSAAWAKAPKKMFALKNPGKAMALKAADFAADHLSSDLSERLFGRRRRRRSVGRQVGYGVAAAAVTVPLGIWAGRKLRERQAEA